MFVTPKLEPTFFLSFFVSKSLFLVFSCVNKWPGANIIKLVIMVIYRNSMAIPSFCVIKLYYFDNYCGMAVNYHGKKFYSIRPWWINEIPPQFTAKF